MDDYELLSIYSLLAKRIHSTNDIRHIQKGNDRTERIVGSWCSDTTPLLWQESLLLQESHVAREWVLTLLANVGKHHLLVGRERLLEARRYGAQERRIDDGNVVPAMRILEFLARLQRRHDAVTVRDDRDRVSLASGVGRRIGDHVVERQVIVDVARVHSTPRIVAILHVAQVEEVGRVDRHHHATGFGLLHEVPEALGVIVAVRVAHDIDARRDVQHVVRVEVATKHAAIKSLEADDHAVRLLAVREPVRDCGLKEDVGAAIEILGVRNLDDRQQARLRVTHSSGNQRGLVGWEVHDSLWILLGDTLRDQVVATMRDILFDSRVRSMTDHEHETAHNDDRKPYLANVHHVWIGFELLDDDTSHMLAHHVREGLR